MSRRLDHALAQAPVVAILRGLDPASAVDTVAALHDAGIRAAEVPLNRPGALEAIALLGHRFGREMAIGAGTVVTPAQVEAVHAAGGTFCVAPNTDRRVISAALDRGLDPVPGFETATEAYAAYDCGARWLKYFPAGAQLAKLRELATVLPGDARVLAVGGIDASNAGAAMATGAAGIGAGGGLWQAGDAPGAVGERARALVAATRASGDGDGGVLTVCAAGATIGESPVWLGDPDRIVWTDPLSACLFVWDIAAARLERHPTPMPVWSLVVADAARGWLWALGDDSLHLWQGTGGGMRAVARLALPPGCRFNDAIAGPGDTIFAGVMHRGLLGGQGALMRITPANGQADVLARGLDVPNGLALDGASLLVVDTKARTLLRYPWAAASEALGEPVIVSDFSGLAGKPDGMAMSADGASALVAMWGGAALAWIDRDGAATALPLPALNPSAPLVAPDGTIWITSSRMRLDRPSAHDGALLRIGAAPT